MQKIGLWHVTNQKPEKIKDSKIDFEQHRCLFTAWTKPRSNRMRVYVVPQAFAEFYPITEEEADDVFGPNGYREMDSSQVNEFIKALEIMMSKIA
jgi:hypothetical protein